MALDPARLMVRAGLKPDSGKSVCCGRQRAGYCLTAPGRRASRPLRVPLAVWEAIYRAPALVLLLSPSLRQSWASSSGKVVDVYRGLGRPWPRRWRARCASSWRTVAAIISLPGTEATIRGYSGVPAASGGTKLPAFRTTSTTPCGRCWR